MLFLQFQLGKDRYALDASVVVEVLPLLEIKRIPHAPDAVVGAFNYRGTPVPAIDLSELAVGRPSRLHMSTRIIVVRYPGANREERLLGLIAERTTETVRRDPAEFADPGVIAADAPYLGPVATGTAGLVQRIEVAGLLPEPVREVLFSQPLVHP